MVEGLKILLSDGDKVFLELSKTYLKKSGVSILTCQNGKEAYDIIRNKRPHMVFMAAEMPIMSGWDCCHTVKMDESLQTIPILLTLSSGKMENVERCQQAGCDDVLIKPINRQTFFSVINRYINLNKRTAPRFAACIPVSLTLSDGSYHSGYTVDISTKGIFLETNDKIPVGSIVCMDFTLPASNVEIKCKARVSWINHKNSSIKPGFPSGIGLEYIELSDANYIRLSEYIRKAHVEPILRRTS
jgi:CheY-like chemotaxis protein/Tfp pilus assembly protein PilZ